MKALSKGAQRWGLAGSPSVAGDVPLSTNSHDGVGMKASVWAPLLSASWLVVFALQTLCHGHPLLSSEAEPMGPPELELEPPKLYTKIVALGFSL